MLKQLMLQKKIDQKRACLQELIEKETAIETRSSELEKSIDEAETDEEVKVVEEEVEKIEADKLEVDEKKSILEGEIEALEGELDEINAKPPTTEKRSEVKHEREDLFMNRDKYFGGATREKMEALVEREEVKSFLQETRSLGAQKRSVSGADLIIPEIMLGMLRANIAESSKLISKVNSKPVKGTARQNISGVVPEAVWTEACASLNELEISFNQVEVDGYKVGGFIPVCNATLNDNDINLASEILSMLSKAIGKAIDKAILFGTGVKMPLGIVTRLAQTSEPSGYSANAPTWEDLHTTNISKVSTTGAALIGSLVTAFGACKNDYSEGSKFFAMNSVTYSKLVTTLLGFNAAGALVTGMNYQMPIIGGDIVILDFLEDNDIVGGYGDLYLLAEREGVVLASSEHAMFIEDMTVFKGLARYDGLPVIANGFFMININNAAATTTETFETDYANTELGALAVVSAASGTATGKTKVTVTGAESTGTTLGYKILGKAAKVNSGDTKEGFIEWNGTVEIASVTGKIITVAEFNADGRAIKVGSASIIVKTA